VPRKALLVCGVLSSVVYLMSIDVIAPLFYPDYHGYTAQMVSELMAAGAPTRTLMFWVGIFYNALILAFAAGVWASARGNRAMRLTAVALAGYGFASTVGGLLTPMDLRTEGLSERTWVHIGATAVQGIFQMAVLVVGAFVYGLRFRLYAFATLLTALVFGAWAGYQSGQDSTPWLGLTERVSIYAYMIWLLILAASLLRTRPSREDSLRAAGLAATAKPSGRQLSQEPLPDSREPAQAESQMNLRGVSQPTWQRITLLSVLGYEGAGALLGGGLLVAAPDGRLMDMPTEIMHAVFPDFLLPGLILIGLGILNTVAFVAVWRRAQTDWLLAGLALGGLLVWFTVEIAILRELHWLHAMWGLPVIAGGLAALPLLPWRPAGRRDDVVDQGLLRGSLR
jgi:hypothetical protein